MISQCGTKMRWSANVILKWPYAACTYKTQLLWMCKYTVHYLWTGSCSACILPTIVDVLQGDQKEEEVSSTCLICDLYAYFGSGVALLVTSCSSCPCTQHSIKDRWSVVCEFLSIGWKGQEGQEGQEEGKGEGEEGKEERKERQRQRRWSKWCVHWLDADQS